MNKYPFWKYILILVVLGLSVVYAMPNLYAPDPALQITGQSGGITIDEARLNSITKALDAANITYFGEEISDDGQSVLIRLKSQGDQLPAQSVLKRALNSEYIIALNMASTTPEWLRNIGAQPMKLGLDLRGGVHFLLEVDTDAAVQANLESLGGQIRSALKNEKIRYRAPKITDNNSLIVEFRNAADQTKARAAIREELPNIIITSVNNDLSLELAISELEIADIEDRALEQNLTALKNRVNELGVSEPLVQRQGKNRIVVELPGIQDTAEAKRIIGKTANLEFRLEYSPNKPKSKQTFEFKSEDVGFGSADLERLPIVTGAEVTDASTGFDENGRPQVSIRLSGDGGAKMHRATANNVGRRMGVLFIEYKTDVNYEFDKNGVEQEIVNTYVEKKIINLATVQSALGVTFRITGVGSQAEASELALLLRAGALAAPMKFVEERTVGPSLGAENIAAGVKSIQLGMLLVVIFMLVYYRAFGLFANLALAANLVMLTAVMSKMGATLTLPGIAGIVLTLGMAVDANVLIFSRIREELKNNVSPQAAIKSGYDRAFTTILDANMTTLIVAAILYLIGTGAVKGFAVTLSIGILTSMFTAIICSRALVNLTYGMRQNVKKLWI